MKLPHRIEVFLLTLASLLVVTPARANQRPTMAFIADVTTYEGASPVVLQLVVEDLETNTADLTLTAQAVNPRLLSASSFVFAYRGGAWEVQITPLPGITDVASITLVVRDRNGGTNSRTFRYQVLPSLRPPEILPVAPLHLWQGGPPARISVALRNPPSRPLTWAVTSSTPDLSKYRGTTTESANGTWQLLVEPAADRSGAGFITVHASLGDQTNSVTFPLLVQKPLVLPDPEPLVPGLSSNSLYEVADFDRDGWPDVVVASPVLGQPTRPRILRQTPRGFVENTPGVSFRGSQLTVHDFDGDGWVDLATVEGKTLRVFRNLGSVAHGLAFEEEVVLSALPTTDPRVVWGDFDGDGRWEGLVPGVNAMTMVHRGTAGWTQSVVGGLQASSNTFVTAADVDGDGDLDVATMSFTYGPFHVWLNNGNGEFPRAPITWPGSSDAGARVLDFGWEDLDNDRVPEPWMLLRVSGSSVGSLVILRRSGAGYGEFARFSTQTRDRRGLAWVDLNQDGWLDWVHQDGGSPGPTVATLVGSELGAGLYGPAGESVLPFTNVVLLPNPQTGQLDLVAGGRRLRNQSMDLSPTPTAPTELRASRNAILHLDWTYASEFRFASGGLTYNVRVGTKPGADDVVASLSLPDGTRLVPRAGNAGKTGFLDLQTRQLPEGRLYWSVQAVDAAFRGGPFAPEQTITPPDVSASSITLAIDASLGPAGVVLLHFSGTVKPTAPFLIQSSTNLTDWGPFLYVQPDADGTYNSSSAYSRATVGDYRVFRGRSPAASDEP